MGNRKLWVMILAGIMAFFLLFGLVGGVLPQLVSATSSLSELEQQLKDLKNEKAELDGQIEELEGQLSENLEDMKDMVTQKDTIDQEIFALQSQMENLNAQIATYSLLIADKQEELDEALVRLEDLTVKNKERIRAMEENGAVSYWSVLFKANNFADFLDRMNMVEEIASSDRRRIKELNAAAKAVEEAKLALETEKLALDESKAELKKTQEELEVKREEANKLLADLVATGEEYEKHLEEMEAEMLVLSGAIDKAQDAYDDAKRQQWLSTSVPAGTSPSGGGGGGTPNSKGWIVPCYYTRISSPFGYRWHPVHGGYRMQNGIDMASPQGTPIKATKSGTVTTASYQAGGAGYYVSINHGGGFSSIYMHMTHYIVRSGQYVEQGQVIGYVGSTGASTGPHLHFGISYNGSYVNPSNYIF